MSNWDRKLHPTYAITEEYRCYAHSILREKIIDKVSKINQINVQNDLKRMKKIAHDKYDWFLKRVKKMQKDTEVGENVANSIKRSIIVHCRESIDTFIYNIVENNCKHYESKTYLQRAFDDAFDKQTGSAEKAMDFVYNQADMMTNAYFQEMQRIQENLLTKKQHKLKNHTLIEHERNEINDIIKSISSRLDELKIAYKNANKSLTAVDVFKCLQGKPIHLAKDWDDCLINQ